MDGSKQAELLFKSFGIGLVFGIFSTYLILNYYPGSFQSQSTIQNGSILVRKTKVELNERQLRVGVPIQLSKPNRPKNLRIDSNVDFNKDMDDEHHKQSRNSTFKIRVLCWVMTSPDSFAKMGKAINETWGKRCDTLLFMSSNANKNLPGYVHVLEGHANLWYQTRAAWQFVFDHHVNEAEWFLKADDDTYIVIQNLKHLCSKYDHDKPHYFGRYFGKYGGFNSGSAGYVFSRETLRRFVKALKDPSLCRSGDTFAEDVEVGKCLANVGVPPGDTRDSRGRETFHPFPPAKHLIPNFFISNYFWMYYFNYYPVKDGPECCSDHSISFHSIDPTKMYLLEYFVYHLRPYNGRS